MLLILLDVTGLITGVLAWTAWTDDVLVLDGFFKRRLLIFLPLLTKSLLWLNKTLPLLYKTLPVSTKFLLLLTKSLPLLYKTLPVSTKLLILLLEVEINELVLSNG